MTDAPERIWVEDEFGEGHEDQWSYGCWDSRQVYDYVHEYVRADLLATALRREAKTTKRYDDKITALEAQLEEVKEALRAIANRDEGWLTRAKSASLARATIAKLEEKK